MSRKSQGVSARKLLKRPCRPGNRGSPLVDDLLADVLQGGQAAVAAVLDDDLEAARRAQAVDRRGAEDVHQPVLDLLLEAGLQRGGDRLAGQAAGRARWWKSSSITYMAPKFGALAPSRIDWPAMATVCLTPLVLRGDLFDAVHDPLGPLHRGGVGQLHVHQQVALVLHGNEAGGRVGEAPLGQASRPP